MSKRKSKKRRTGKMPPGLRAYWAKKNATHHKRKGTTDMAKRKSGKSKSKGRKRSGGGRRGGGGRRRRHGGGGGGALSVSSFMANDLPLIAGGALAGFMESSLKKDGDKSFFSKVPTPVAQLGRTGNTALLAYGLSYFLPGKWRGYVRKGACSLAVVTAYQLTRKGEAFKEGSELFSISGLAADGLSGEEFLGDDDIGELDDEIGRRFHLNADIDTDAGDGPVHPDEIHPDDSHAPPA